MIHVPGDRLRPGDVIYIGGTPHAITDIREIHDFCKRLQSDDGNACVLARSALVEVTRTYRPRRARSPATLPDTTCRFA
ncbi:hypothetical protein [Streptomyces sp. NPDC006925]|uniref:hypothetical protein n=1 Tax=Streptomyces sp. NPDC006925 TaxID=3364768 RepID=UPI0036789E27